MLKLKNIYCRHLLPTDNLNKYKNNCKRTVFYIDPHHIFEIKDSINYHTLANNDFTLYNEYVVKTNQHDHSVEKYKNLLETFDLIKMDKIDVEYNSKINRYIILDGCHRLSILYFKKIIGESIPLSFLNIKYNEETINYIKKILSNTTGKMYYNGWNNRTNYGYHSFHIDNINIIGQRQPHMRINYMKKFIDFNDKIVVDFGCNTGGMLLHLPEIKQGYGFDYSDVCIDCATKINNILLYDNDIKFIKQDLNDFNFNSFVNDNNLDKKIDIIFLLSLGSWIKNWRKLYTDSFRNCKTIILETNNDKEGLPQLNLFKELGASIKIIIEKSLDDTTNNFGRKTYIISK